MKRIVLVVLLMSLSSAIVRVVIATGVEAKGDKHPLADYVVTEQMVDEAIKEGFRKEKGRFRRKGLSLEDSPTWLDRGGDTTGFSLDIYTPYAWIAQQAQFAARRENNFTRADLTEDMVETVLHVVANPDRPKQQGSQAVGASGVDHVIIRSTAEEDFEVLQPSSIEEGSAYLNYRRMTPYVTKRAEFDLEAVVKIAELDKKGEFFIVVIGTTGEERDFKVKKKHLEQLLEGEEKLLVGGGGESRPWQMPSTPSTPICVPTLETPQEGELLDNGCAGRSDPTSWTFTWSSCEGADAYHLFVMGSTARNAMIDKNSLTTTSYQHRGDKGYVIDRNRKGWGWKVRALQNDRWGEWTDERTFDVEPLDTDCRGTS